MPCNGGKNANALVLMSPSVFKSGRKMAPDIIKIGIPAALITVLMSIANIVLNNYIAIYGSDAVAAYGISYKIDMFPIMLLVGLSQGVAPLIGYYYGKKERNSLSKTMKIGTIYGMTIGAFFSFAIFFSSDILGKIFVKDEALLSNISILLKLLCFHAPLLGIINMVTAYFQALGKAKKSLLITVLRNVILFIPGTIVMNYLFKLNGVILTQLVVEIVLSIICLVLYKLNAPKKYMLEAKASDLNQSLKDAAINIA